MIESDELKRIELEILTDFAKVCEQNGLRYCLGGGTLLGAVRHKGFIPWDDDVDVSMPRPDYMKFVEMAPVILPENLRLYTIYTNKDYYHPFARLCDNRTVFRETLAHGCELGVNIDIFPIEGLPLKVSASNLHFFLLDILHPLRALSLTKKMSGRSFLRSLLKAPAMLFAKAFGADLWLRWIDKLARKYDFEKSDYTAVVVSGNYGKRERLDRLSYESYVKVEFERKQFNAPIGYDRYLTNMYGDYMQPPPEEMRQSKHYFEAYWK